MPMLLPSDRQLDAFRSAGDPLADEVVSLFYERLGRYPAQPIEALRELAERGVAPADELWAHLNEVPTWVDFDLMEGAFEVALQNVFPSGLALMAGSLVESYASGRGAKVLIRTGRLETDTFKRLFETAKFAADIALCRGARPGNAAWRNVVAVRLLHARVRKFVVKSPGWNFEAWGLPVNQEDYAGTLFMFSLVYRRSLERIGVRFSERAQDGGHANWRWVGHLMGVHPGLLTTTRAEELALYGRMRRRNYFPDDDSRTLAHGLIKAMAGGPPFFLPRAALYSLSRRMIGDELADDLQFPRSTYWGHAVGATGFVNSITARAAGRSGRFAVRLGEHLTRTIVDLGLPGGTTFA